MKKEKKSSQVPELLKTLQQGVRDVFESDSYRKYLLAMAKFHIYSANNQLLIYLQRPGASFVASVRTWNKFNRHVKKGEKGIRILVPTPVRILQDEGSVDGREEEEQKILRFKIGHVFDLSQTEGEPLPSYGVRELSGVYQDYERFMEAAEKVSPVPIRFEPAAAVGEAKGFYDRENNVIVLREDLSEVQMVKTALHEISHAVLHSWDAMKADGRKKDRMTMEVEAESSAFVCACALGIDPDVLAEYSFPYVAGWSSGKDLKELTASLGTVRDAAEYLIGAFGEAMGRKGGDLN